MTYQELVDAAKAYADRLDAEVDANMSVFILMAEARINRILKVGGQTHRVYTNTVAGREFYTLPKEYNGMRIVQFNSGSPDNSSVIQLHYVTPEHIVNMQQANLYDGANYYTILNNQLQLHNPLPSGGTLEMVFYRKVPPLSNLSPTNWMSIEHPDVYLSGICCEIELFVKNSDAAQLWDQRMMRAAGEIQDQDDGNRWSGATMTIKAE